MTTIATEERDELERTLIERIRNWCALREDAFQTECPELIDIITERIQEDRRQLAALRA